MTSGKVLFFFFGTRSHPLGRAEVAAGSGLVWTRNQKPISLLKVYLGICSRHLYLSYLPIRILAVARLPSSWSLFLGPCKYITCLELPTILSHKRAPAR
jgi:hypothetical protein